MTLSSPFIGEVTAPALHLMTLNVRRRMPRLRPGRADRWDRRRPALQQLLAIEHPSLLGLQEVLPTQSSDIEGMLGSGYESVGSGRDAHRDGERCELHVDTERLRIIDSHTWWLSTTPNVPGSRSFGNVFPRIVLEAEVEDRVDGARWLVLVTHFDHLSERSRRASARLVLDVVRRAEGRVVVLGDFNTGVDSPAHRLLTGSDRLVDAFDVAAIRPTPDWGSFSHYRRPRVGARRLDWILVDPGTEVEMAAVNPARFAGVAASDHDPVQAVVRRGTTHVRGGASNGELDQ